MADPADRSMLSDRIQNWGARGLMGAALALPYAWRVPAMGWLTSAVVAPLAGLRTRIRENLGLVVPDLPEEDVRRLTWNVPNNMGRTLIEVYSGNDFYRHCATLTLGGDGWPDVKQAAKDQRPVVIVTGHFGNYDALRVALIQAGCQVGAIYRPFNNPFFDAHYRSTINRIGPIWPRGPNGLTQMVKHLKGGGMAAIAADQFVSDGAPVSFFGRAAATSLASAKLALKFDALLVAGYGIRREDGLNFDLVLEKPVDPATPEEMTEKLNASLEAQIRAHMDQWMWTHRRWKGAAPITPDVVDTIDAAQGDPAGT